MKLVIEIDEEVYKEIASHTDKYYSFVYLSLDQLRRLDNAIRYGRPLEDYLYPHQDKHIDEWLEGARKNGQFISEHMKRNCADCILDGTDACSRGAGRAVDDEVCKDFLKGE